MRQIFLVFEGFQLLDLSGPAGVFAGAAEALGRPSGVVTVSATGGPVRSKSGIAVASVACRSVSLRDDDMLFVVGGDGPGLAALMADADTADWFRRGATAARRHGSICTGSFVLAAWGLLDGRRCTTHWHSARRLAAGFPAVHVDADAMFVADGKLWTSAGVTTGIDMALAIVEADAGAALANTIARRLVLSVRRPGHQSQFSPLLDAPTKAGSRYAALVEYIAANLGTPLDVDTLAARVGESPRSFHRHFVAATGKTPAAFVAAARLDRARMLIGEGMSLKATASACGFATAEQMSRRFSQAFGVAPGAWRTMNTIASAPPRR
jgi:transcriptional regulator GlxA family with amidase domain